MSEQQKILVVFPEKADLEFSEIIKKYHLNEEEDSSSSSIFLKDSNAVIILNLIRYFVSEKISAKELLENLRKELGVPKETVKNIALDIFDNLIPLLEKVPENELKEYNHKKSGTERKNENQEIESEEERREAISKAKEELLRKLRANVTIEKPIALAPTVKKTEISDVEENAEKIKTERQPILSAKPENPAVPPPETPKPPTKPDPYKEPVE